MSILALMFAMSLRTALTSGAPDPTCLSDMPGEQGGWRVAATAKQAQFCYTRDVDPGAAADCIEVDFATGRRKAIKVVDPKGTPIGFDPSLNGIVTNDAGTLRAALSEPDAKGVVQLVLTDAATGTRKAAWTVGQSRSVEEGIGPPFFLDGVIATARTIGDKYETTFWDVATHHAIGPPLAGLGYLEPAKLAGTQWVFVADNRRDLVVVDIATGKRVKTVHLPDAARSDSDGNPVHEVLQLFSVDAHAVGVLVGGSDETGGEHLWVIDLAKSAKPRVDVRWTCGE